MTELNHAIIENGIVINIISLTPGTEFPNAIPYGNLQVQIGDTYVTGKFYHEGVIVTQNVEDNESDI